MLPSLIVNDTHDPNEKTLSQVIKEKMGVVHSESYQPKSIKLRSFPVSEVLSNDHILFNTNNHWKNNLKPLDYALVLERCNTSSWVDLFHFNEYFTLVIDKVDLNWMFRAQQIGMTSGKFSEIFEDELLESVKKYEIQFSNFDPNSKYFVRTESVSLKHGLFGAGPFCLPQDLNKVFMSLCSGLSGHEAIPSNSDSLKLFFFPWIDDLDKEYEFRGFIHHNKLTSLSIQSIYRPNNWCMKLNEQGLLTQQIRRIIAQFYDRIQPKLIEFDSYVVDMVWLEKQQILYFIEINPFGSQYASGSALFHWINDRKLLYGETEDFEFRYTTN